MATDGRQRRWLRAVPIGGKLTLARFHALGLAGIILLSAASGAAQTGNSANGDPPDPVGEIQSLISDIETRVNSIERSTSGSDTALDLLNEQVEEAIAKLTSRLDENVALRERASGLTSEIQSLAEEESDLQGELARLEAERGGAISALEQQVALLADELAADTAERQRLEERISFLNTEIADTQEERTQLRDALATAQSTGAETQAKLAEQSAVLAELRDDVGVLRAVRDDLERQIASLAGALETGRSELTEEATRGDELRAALERSQAALAEARQRALNTAEGLRASREELLEERSQALTLSRRLTDSLDGLSQAKARADELASTLEVEKRQRAAEVAERDQQLSTLTQQAKRTETSLDRERKAAVAARDRVSLLTEQMAELKRQLQALNKFLVDSETKNAEQRAQIVDLGSRLNQALATRVQELANYRSEFFGRLREVLGARSDVRVVGDRFVFQSEVLFASGEAELGHDGREQLQQLATTLTEISATIPADVDWVLRVDGHTDERPISNEHFPSNWELSAARALSVVKFLIDSGIPPDRLVAAGFGQFHPLDQRRDEIGFRRNRRIEFKLTQR